MQFGRRGIELRALSELSSVLQAFLATCFTWALTALGASFVFFTRSVSRRLLDGALGFAAGVMIAASFWSLLVPAITMSEELGLPEWLPPAAGFLAGGLALRSVDRVLPHLHLFLARDQAEGLSSTWRRTTLLIMAMTLHNFPEGMAVGVAFGAAAAGLEGASLAAALSLAIGIGIQNFPEGMAVAMPLRGQGISKLRSFWYGQLSAVVEPVAAVLGAAAVLAARPILPYALAFAAGAMIFVVVEEVIPESQQAGNTDIATLSALFGFAIMMALDVALG
jgi:ZIP family zinc transporter